MTITTQRIYSNMIIYTFKIFNIKRSSQNKENCVTSGVLKFWVLFALCNDDRKIQIQNDLSKIRWNLKCLECRYHIYNYQIKISLVTPLLAKGRWAFVKYLFLAATCISKMDKVFKYFRSFLLCFAKVVVWNYRLISYWMKDTLLMPHNMKLIVCYIVQWWEENKILWTIELESLLNKDVLQYIWTSL